MKPELRLVDVPRDQHEFARGRISFLLSERAMLIAKHDLLDLLAMAYAQGLSDTLEALEGRGVNLAPIESSGGASTPQPQGETRDERGGVGQTGAWEWLDLAQLMAGRLEPHVPRREQRLDHMALQSQSAPPRSPVRQAPRVPGGRHAACFAHGAMDPRQVAHRLRKAEAELQRAQRHHDGSLKAVERYRAAVSEHRIAQAVAELLLSEP